MTSKARTYRFGPITLLLLLTAHGAAAQSNNWRASRRQASNAAQSWDKHNRAITKAGPTCISFVAVCTLNETAGCDNCRSNLLEQPMKDAVASESRAAHPSIPLFSPAEYPAFAAAFRVLSPNESGIIDRLSDAAIWSCKNQEIDYVGVFHRISASYHSNRVANVALGAVPGDQDRFPEYHTYTMEVRLSVYEISTGKLVRNTSEQESDRSQSDGIAAAIEELIEDLMEGIGWGDESEELVEP